MTQEVFQAPLIKAGIISENKNEERVNSVSMMLRDANNEFFSLVIQTLSQYNNLQGKSNANETDEDSIEPVFIVPAYSINEPIIDDVLNGVTPRLLAFYLVPQETDA